MKVATAFCAAVLLAASLAAADDVDPKALTVVKKLGATPDIDEENPSHPIIGISPRPGGSFTAADVKMISTVRGLRKLNLMSCDIGGIPRCCG
jgi:hypothetical protein